MSQSQEDINVNDKNEENKVAINVGNNISEGCKSKESLLSDKDENVNNNRTSTVSSSTKTSDVTSRPITSFTETSKNESDNLNKSLSQESAELFGKLYKPHSPKDESDMKELDNITKLFNSSMSDISKGNEQGNLKVSKEGSEDNNMESLVKNLSGFLNPDKDITDISNEPIRNLKEIMAEVTEEEKQDTEYVIGKIKNEYNRLSKLLVNSRMNESVLYNKCTDLSRFLNSCIVKIQGVLNMSRNDRMNLVNLNLELEKAWKRIEEKNESEALLKETIDLLKKEIVKYRKRVKGKLDDLPDNLIDESTIQVEEDETVDYVKGLEEVNRSLLILFFLKKYFLNKYF